MRILHLSRTMDQGGAEKVVFQLVCACKEKNIFTTVASCGGAYVKELNRMGISHYEIHDFEKKGIWSLLKTYQTLVQIIKKDKITILHNHHRMAAFYGWLLKMRFPKLKVVYTAHNVFYDKRFLTKNSIKQASIVAVGANVKKNLEEFFKVNKKNITIIYNAVMQEQEGKVDEAMLAPFEIGKDVLVGIIGRLSEQKGIDVYIKAMQLAHEKDARIKGVIIGDGELAEQVKEWIAEFGLQDVILMMGYQSKVVDWVRMLDFVVMPSRWEGFPLTPIEVFMAGKTIIGSDIGGINEIVEEGVNGLLVEKDKPEAFAEKILELTYDMRLRRQLEEAGYETYRKKFDYQQFVDKYLSVYESITK